MLGDITRTGVEAAVSEFDELGRDEFLDKYGYARARGYFLVRNGNRYDSKAICGAAHGFDRPAEGPLRPGDFSGGNATVGLLLERLGFEVTRPASNRTGWTSEERIIALDLYLRVGVAGRTHPDVIALPQELNQRRFHPDAGSRENFRNPNGVALKLANFAALDPSYAGAGMTSHSAGDEEAWDLYSGDADLLDPIYAERRESQLVGRFADWLRQRGATVTAHHYAIVQPPLRNDLANETDRRLWEAKADVSRSSVRMALGQLLDYLRFEPPTWRGGVLLPHPPSDDLVELIRTSGHAVAWPTTPTTFKITEPRTDLPEQPQPHRPEPTP